MQRKGLVGFFASLFLTLLTGLRPAIADDTDIYLNPSVPSGSEPLVMFSLDYRPNLTSTASAESEQYFRDHGMSADVDELRTIGGDKWTFFDVLILSLKLVLSDIHGVKIGLMFNHADVGSTGGPAPEPPPTTKGFGDALVNADCIANGLTAATKDCDGDGIKNNADYCPTVVSAANLHTDDDKWGDVCDNCPLVTQTDQVDADGDGVGDVCDLTPTGDPSSGDSGFVADPTSSNGGVILRGFESLDADSLDEFIDKLIALKRLKPQANSPDHPYQGSELFFEFFRYLTGQGIYNGHNGIFDFEAGGGKDATTNMRCTSADADINPACWDSGIESGANYVTPITEDTACTKVFTVNFLFQVSQAESDSTIFTSAKASGGLGTSAPASQNNFFPAVLEYLNDADLADGSYGTVDEIDGLQNVTSYFLVDETKINVTTNGYATAGGTGNALPLSDDPEQLVENLTNIFKSILSVSTTFVAPSVPVNVFNRSEIVNEVFFALFEADEDGFPFWPGNLKKLVLGRNSTTGDVELQDANSVQAIDIDGRIKREAVTVWTDPGTLPAPGTDEVAGADGRAIQRGGAGQKIPGYASGSPGLANSDAGARKIFTDDASDNVDGLLPLAADADTADAVWTALTAKWPVSPGATFDAASDADKNQAIAELCFARGFASTSSAAGVNCDTKRAWFLADPLHSRPRPINYGARGGYTDENPDIRILMGTNDGQMHMFTDKSPDGADSGAETWAFMPRATLSILNRLHENIATAPVHPIAVDGSPAVIVHDQDSDGTIEPDDGDTVWAFFGLRRGGKAYYALDITDPDNPRFMWSIDKTTVGFEELAQTWSTPQTGQVQVGPTLVDANVVDVLVFGGGYNGDDDGDNAGDLGKDAANRDSSSGVGTDDDEGNALFVVNAETGELIWKAAQTLGAEDADDAVTEVNGDMADSIAADVTAVDTDGDGLLDRVYAGDTGGVIWRADLAGRADPLLPVSADNPVLNHNVTTWTIVPFASVGRHFSNTLADDRRFFTRVDVVQTLDDSGKFDAILAGTGDREAPLTSSILNPDVTNHFYMFKDRKVSSGDPPTETLNPDDLADFTADACVADVTADGCDDTNIGNGWFFELLADGEKNLAAPITIGGLVFFTTFVPGGTAGSACGLSEGSGKVYAVSLFDATAFYNYDTTNDEGGTTKERSDELASGGIPVEVVPLGQDLLLVQGQEAGENIVEAGVRTNWKTFWYEHTTWDDDE